MDVSVSELNSKVNDLLVILASLEEVQTAIQRLDNNEMARSCLEVSRFITSKVMNELDGLALDLMGLKQ